MNTSDNNLKSAIEALLFSSDKPLTPDQLKTALDVQGREEILFALDELKTEYENSNRGVRIAEIAGGYQMVTAPTFTQFLRKLYKGRKIEKLSKPALETLAIVAYKQPISKSEIESLRSVSIDGVVESLLEKELIRITGRKKTPGRPFVYGTSKRFLEYFGLKSLDELPKMENLSLSPQITEEQNAPKEPAPEN